MRDIPRTVVVTSIPSPYRNYFYDQLTKQYGNFFTVIYCSKTEANREWNIDEMFHQYIYLPPPKKAVEKRRPYNNISIFNILKKLNPDVVITAGFNPTMLYAWLWTIVRKRKHIVYTDSWLKTIDDLSIIHKIVRKIVFKFSASFLCIGKKGLDYLLYYGIEKSKIYVCPIVIDYNKYLLHNNSEKKYDLIFSGQFIVRKMPMFFCDVAVILKKFYPDLKVLVLGSGPLKTVFINRLTEEKIDFDYPGFIQQDKLPEYYGKSRIFLFPTLSDPWGVVANEACASGLPVITCENSGAAGELVLNDYNGYVLPLDANIWVNKILGLLNDKALLKNFSNNSLAQCEVCSIENAMNSFISAVKNA